MTKNNTLYIITLWLVLLLNSCQSTRDQGITIATAANVQFAMQELTQAFTQTHGIACQTVISSSGKLTAQIKEGAPYDVFVSANMKYPHALYNNGLAAEAPKVYTLGKLVLWTQKDDLNPELKSLSDNKIKHLAIANPRTAPYGEAAVEVLKKTGVYNRLKSKLVYGESISQTNQFIISETAQMGFTAKSVVVSPKLKAKGKWVEIAPGLYPAIKQGVILLKQKHREAKSAQAKKFYDFLFSAKAKEILQKYGYQTTELTQ